MGVHESKVFVGVIHDGLRLILLPEVALLLALVPVGLSGQDANVVTGSLVLRHVQTQYLGRFDDAACEQVQARLEKRGLVPEVGAQYDPQKVEKYKKAIQQIWKERGLDVGVRAEFSRIAGTNAAELLFLVYKQ